MLTKELLEHLFYWDKENGKFFWKNPNKYHAKLKGKEAGCLTEEGYWTISINGKKYKRGRLCFLMEYGRFPIQCVDHKNRIKHDDRICNLREASQTQNSWNYPERKKKSDLPEGVRITKSGKFLARISYNKIKISLGSYNTANEASFVYQKKRRELYGEFAVR